MLGPDPDLLRRLQLHTDVDVGVLPAADLFDRFNFRSTRQN